MELQTYLRKMGHCVNADHKVEYYFRGLSEESVQNKTKNDADKKYDNLLLNDYLGKKIKLEFQNDISCVGCGREIKKTFNQGYCFPCLQSLAECDTCIIKPELCHYDEGTCRDNEFGDSHCNIKHTIYLSLTSGAKIGITRSYNEMTRWVDQGAVKALKIAEVDRRKDAGLIEIEIAKSVKDKTNWRNMLKNEYEDVDLYELRDQLFEEYEDIIADVAVEGAKEQKFEYPVLEYPTKVKSFNFDKNPLVEGTLQGIKGQYLILDEGVINLRKFAGYKVAISV